MKGRFFFVLRREGTEAELIKVASCRPGRKELAKVKLSQARMMTLAYPQRHRLVVDAFHRSTAQPSTIRRPV